MTQAPIPSLLAAGKLFAGIMYRINLHNCTLVELLLYTSIGPIHPDSNSQEDPYNPFDGTRHHHGIARGQRHRDLLGRDEHGMIPGMLVLGLQV